MGGVSRNRITWREKIFFNVDQAAKICSESVVKSGFEQTLEDHRYAVGQKVMSASP
eukprot:SAG11_NODE_20460_length_444_cov_3.907246_1_plen_55_part_10